nr:hypothetical protein OG999_12380 [Streptomyces sp. NBC_00886]
MAFAPAWIVQHDIGVHGASQLSAADRLKAVNDVRVVLLQGAAGLVALGGIGLGSVLTLRQIRVSREGQFIDLFARAIEQLSSEQVSVRHGGAYAMEQIADAAPHYRGHVAALQASFVRQQPPGRRHVRPVRWTPSGCAIPGDSATMSEEPSWR